MEACGLPRTQQLQCCLEDRSHLLQRQLHQLHEPFGQLWVNQSQGCIYLPRNHFHVTIVYSSSRLVPLCLSPILFPSSDKFQWSLVGEGLWRTDAVVSLLPALELLVEKGHLGELCKHLIKLLVVGAVRTLDMAIEFG